MLRAENIQKWFGDRQALRDVTIEVPPGRITALIGPSGGGKSTLLRALALLEPPEVGSVAVDGIVFHFPSDGTPIQGIWPTVTVVFQQLFLWPHLTLRENILLPLRLRKENPNLALVEQLIAQLDMREYIDRYANQVSVGQRQRAAVARAVALRPRYLLLDEITSALDAEHVGRMLRLLVSLRAEGAGILLVTHLIGFARKSADQIVFLENGVVVESGDKERLNRPHTPRLAEFLSLVEVMG